MSGSMFEEYFSEMKCALDLLDQCGTLQKMSTGSPEIDSLIDGIQEGSFYLLYASRENQQILDSLFYRQLIGCILPKSNRKNGFESISILFNNIDPSSDRNKRQILNPEKIAIISKYAEIEPKIVFKNLLVQTAYNQEHQVTVAEEIAAKIESNHDIKLLAIKDLTKFITVDDDTNRNVNDDTNTLKKTLGMVYSACARNKVTIVATGNCKIANSGFIPKPTGGAYLRHIANVIVHIKPNYWTTTTAANNNNGGSPYVLFKATMIKHPYYKTTKSVNFYAKRIGKLRNPMLFILN